jgi:hypothetical protein
MATPVTGITDIKPTQVLIGNGGKLTCTVLPFSATQKKVDWAQIEASAHQGLLVFTDGMYVAYKRGTYKLFAIVQDGKVT